MTGTDAALPESSTNGGGTVTPPPPPPPSTGLAVKSFTLIDAVANKAMSTHDPLGDGATLSLAALPTALNIRANVQGSAQSVRFDLNGKKQNVENTTPYALFGDSGTGDYDDWVPSLGSYTVKATPYSGASATGQAGTPDHHLHRRCEHAFESGRSERYPTARTGRYPSATAAETGRFPTT